MKVDENVRKEIHREMEALNKDLWKMLVSEIQYFGEELPFFFLIEGGNKVRPAFDAAVSVLNRYMPLYKDTKFNLGFSEKRDGNEIIWDAIDDHELRTGRLYQPLGESPDVLPLRDQDVFGVNRLASSSRS